MEVYFKGIVVDGFGIYLKRICKPYYMGVVNSGDSFCCLNGEDKSSEKKGC